VRGTGRTVARRDPGRRPARESEGVGMAVEDRIKEIIVDQLGVSGDEIVPEASFIDDLGADSLDIVELVMAMEEAFDVEIPDDDAEKIQTIGDAISYLKEKLAAS
jgi:acyl carrier protein